MNVLAVDTATEACSVALLVGDAVVERWQFAPRAHTQLLLPMIGAVLAEAGCAWSALDGIAFGRGPGAFVGVRIATACAQALAYAHGLPVAPVSTLAALAAGAGRRHGATRVLAAIDARMGEVYAGAWTLDAAGRPTVEALLERVCAPAALALDGAWFGAGSGFAAYGEALAACIALAGSDPQALPYAADVARLGAQRLADGAGVAPAAAQPVYLRDEVAKKAGARG